MDLSDPALLLLFLGIALLTGLLAGLYPAFFLSHYRPVEVFKRTADARGGGTVLRKGLVTLQFAISVALICGTLVVQFQLDYIQSKRLGYDTEQILSIAMRAPIDRQVDAFKQSLLNIPGVTRAATASGPPNTGWESMAGPEDHEHRARWLYTDADYLATMGMELVAGRFFDPQLASDTSAFLINETGARLFGLTDAVGQTPDTFLKDKTLIGIVRDFHTTSLHEPIMPTFMEWVPARQRAFVVRVALENLDETLAGLENVWDTFVPAEPFAYHFLDAMLAEKYQAEQRLARIFGAFSALAILIACLGLFGLAAFTAEQRTKEVGIRKVMGASVGQIVLLLSKDFVALVGLAFVLGMPVAYFGMRRWLDGFAYRIDLDARVFLVAGVLALCIAALTVSYQSIKAALSNPVDALRSE